MGERYWQRILPHWEKPGAAYFVTYRLFGSLPRPLIDQLQAKRKRLEAEQPRQGEGEREKKLRTKKAVFSRWDDELAKRTDNSWLTQPKIAKMVRENLHYHAGTKYDLFAYVIMPNHVHVLFQPCEDSAGQAARAPDATAPCPGYVEFPQSPTFEKSGEEGLVLPGIIHSLKSYTANEANKILGNTGHFWQPGYFDHWVRDLNEFGRIAEYIEHNPVAASLADTPATWRWSSAYDRSLLGSEPGEPLPPDAAHVHTRT